MAEQKYKRVSSIFIITLALFFISFLADIYLVYIKENFKPDFLFAVITIIAALCYLAFMRILIWTLWNKEGKTYWKTFFEKRNLQNMPAFSGKEPADVIRAWVIVLAVLAVGAVLLVVI